ncbi:hypothetical protein FRX31_016342 [Thalictrum thalictroides]|uniref:Uncharacterized protein n=1 Tax=Thalictrum thalictroides TaxID=46969 RepID=A0A7J6WCY7_THATH|nr:hypothetical protein FRX31_016342 [Thalictrum thalictroides]
MASSLYFLSNGNTVGGEEIMNQHENNTLLFGQPDEIGNKRAAGKKNGKVNNNNQKKQPQRGLGVEKLERLRIEGLKKVAEIEGEGSYAPVASHGPFHYHHHRKFNFPFTYGGGSVTPVHHVSFAAGFVGGHGNSNVYEVHHPVAAAATVNLGFSPHDSRFFTGGGFTMVPMTTNFGFIKLQTKSSSIQITDSISNNFGNSWNKKKKLLINGGVHEVLGYDGEKTEMEINDCDSLALSLGLNSSTNIESKVKACGLNLHDQEAEEVMTMHRKRNGGDAGRRGESVLMEYEFLPHHKGSTRSNNDNSTSVSEGRLVLGHEASPTNNTNFLDLSLKLSCYN